MKTTQTTATHKRISQSDVDLKTFKMRPDKDIGKNYTVAKPDAPPPTYRDYTAKTHIEGRS